MHRNHKKAHTKVRCETKQEAFFIWLRIYTYQLTLSVAHADYTTIIQSKHHAIGLQFISKNNQSYYTDLYILIYLKSYQQRKSKKIQSKQFCSLKEMQLHL